MHKKANPGETDICKATECFYGYSCKEVLQQDFSLDFDIGLSLKFSEMLVDGEEFEDEGNCYLPFFTYAKEPMATDWKIGAILMQKYYWVFDATPSTELGLMYNQIGIGLEDHTKEAEIGVFDSIDLEFFEEYILFIYAVIVILVLLVLGCCYISCL